jgi:hypothetical protein
MNPQRRPFAYPTVSAHTPSAPVVPTVAAVAELEADARWNQWAEKGRREEADFRDKSRVIAVIAGVGLAVLALVWAFVSL